MYPLTGYGRCVLRHFALFAVLPASCTAFAQYRTGLDALVDRQFSTLRGKPVAVVCNAGATDRQGQHLLQCMVQSGTVQLSCVLLIPPGMSYPPDASPFLPAGVPTGTHVGWIDGSTPPEMLAGAQLVLFDALAIGVRFEPAVRALRAVLRLAAARRLPLVVLDRPTVLASLPIDGPLPDDVLVRAAAAEPVPVLFRLTLGELAYLCNAEENLGVDIQVVPIEGWHRAQGFVQSGPRWIAPAGGVESATHALCYPALLPLEAGGLSVARGTPLAFRAFGHPTFDGLRLERDLDWRELAGVRVRACAFVPTEGPFAGERCAGVELLVADTALVRPVELGLHLIDAVYRLYPQQVSLDRTAALVGAAWVLEEILDGTPIAVITELIHTDPALTLYRNQCSRVWLYPERSLGNRP